MTPDEVADIFAEANTAYEIVTSKLTYADIDKFDEKVKSILVELIIENDGDEFWILYLSQDPSKYSNLNEGSTLIKTGPIFTYDSSIDAEATDSERKRAEVV